MYFDRNIKYKDSIRYKDLIWKYINSRWRLVQKFIYFDRNNKYYIKTK